MSALLTNDIVLETLALPDWVAEAKGNRTILTHSLNTNGYIAIDWELQAIAYCSHTWSEEGVTELLERYGQTAQWDFNVLRLLGAEGCAIGVMKNPQRQFASLPKLFRAMDARSQSGQGTSAVYGYVWFDSDGSSKWCWVLIEWDEKDKVLKEFEAAVAALKETRNLGNEVSAKRAQNVIDFLTRAALSDHWLKVGELTQNGWQWLLDASPWSVGELGDDVDTNRVRCNGAGCEFAESIMWQLGYTGEFVAKMHGAYEQHKEFHPECMGDVR